MTNTAAVMCTSTNGVAFVLETQNTSLLQSNFLQILLITFRLR